MTALVSTDEAIDHLRLDESTDELELKIEIASGILMDFLKLADIPASWYSDASPTELAVPSLIKGAVLLMASELYENREASVVNVLSPAIKDLLRRYRDPALA